MKHKNLVPLSEDMECMTTTNGYAECRFERGRLYGVIVNAQQIKYDAL